MIVKRVSDEEAAMFSADISEGELIELVGVSVWVGKHPKHGQAVIISPSMGSNLIVANPFAGDDVSS